MRIEYRFQDKGIDEIIQSIESSDEFECVKDDKDRDKIQQGRYNVSFHPLSQWAKMVGYVHCVKESKVTIRGTQPLDNIDIVSSLVDLLGVPSKFVFNTKKPLFFTYDKLEQDGSRNKIERVFVYVERTDYTQTNTTFKELFNERYPTSIND